MSGKTVLRKRAKRTCRREGEKKKNTSAVFCFVFAAGS
jgi:hypothetical protein